MKRLLTIKEACAYAKMGRSKLYLKLNAREITAYRREGQTLVDADSIDAMNDRTCEPWKPDAAGGTLGVHENTPKPQTP